MRENPLNEFARYLKELITHMNEIRYDILFRVQVGRIELSKPVIYFKNLINLERGETYADILTSKDTQDRRIKWRSSSQEENRKNEYQWTTKPEQNEFKGRIVVTKEQLPYRGEIIFELQSDGVKRERMIFSGPLMYNTDIDLEKKQIRFTIRKGLDKMEPYNCRIYFNWRNSLMQRMILEEPEFIVVYDLEIHMIERDFSLERYNSSNAVLPIKSYQNMENESKQLMEMIDELHDKEREEDDETKKEEIRRNRRKSVTDKFELDGILTLMRETLKDINVEPVRRESIEDIPGEQQGTRNDENKSFGGVMSKIAKKVGMITEGKKPGKGEKSTEVESSEKAAQTARPTPRFPSNPQTVQTTPIPMVQVRYPVYTNPPRLSTWLVPPQQRGNMAIQGIPRIMSNGIPNQNITYSNPNGMPNMTYGYSRMNGFQMEEPSKGDPLIIRGECVMPYVPTISVDDMMRLPKMNVDVTDRTVSPKRIIFREIVQHVNNMLKGRGEIKTYKIYLKNINTVFKDQNIPAELVLKIQSLQIWKRDIFEKGSNRKQHISSKKSNIKTDFNGFKEDGKFIFGEYMINGQVEILLMIYSDGEYLTYIVNNIEPVEQETN